MTEDVVQQISEEPVIAESATAELSPIEQEAMKQGWRPKTEFSGDDKDFVGAEAYIARGPLIKENKELRKAIDKITQDTMRIEKVVYERAKKELEAEAAKAWAVGDRDKFNQVQSEIQDLKPVTQQHSDPLQDPVVQEFIRENPHLKNPTTEEDFEMQALAQTSSAYYEKNHPGSTHAENIEYVKERLKTRFPHRYKNMEREAPSAVVASRPKASAPASNNKGPHPEYHKLSETQRMIGERLTNQRFSKITWDQYIAQLKQDGRLESK